MSPVLRHSKSTAPDFCEHNRDRDRCVQCDDNVGNPGTLRFLREDLDRAQDLLARMKHREKQGSPKRGDDIEAQAAKCNRLVRWLADATRLGQARKDAHLAGTVRPETLTLTEFLELHPDMAKRYANLGDRSHAVVKALDIVRSEGGTA